SESMTARPQEPVPSRTGPNTTICPESRYGCQWAACRAMMSFSSSVKSTAKVGRGGISRITKVAMTFRCGSTGAHPRPGRASSAADQSLDRTFGQADDVALGVGEEGKRQTEVREFSWPDHDRAAQLLGLLQVCRRVVDLDVERHATRPAVLAGPDAATDALLSCLDQPVAGPVTGVVHRPVKQRRVEPLNCRSVLTGDFEPTDDWLGHVAPPQAECPGGGMGTGRGKSMLSC